MRCSRSVFRSCSGWAGVGLGTLVAGLSAVGLSVAVLRLKGVYFAVGTLVVPEAARMVFYLWRPVGGVMHGAGAGYMVKGIGGLSEHVPYALAWAGAVGSALVMRAILRSNFGLGLAAIRENERSAASSGIDVIKLKLCAFVIGAAITGLAGCAFYLNQGYIEPSATFHVKWTMSLLLATVIGGIRTEHGPLLGCVVVVALHFSLARYGGYSLLVQGVVLLVMLWASPQGLARPIGRWHARMSSTRVKAQSDMRSAASPRA